MLPLAMHDKANKKWNSNTQTSQDVLYRELEKGIQSMKNGEVYTIEQAWEEIDKI